MMFMILYGWLQVAQLDEVWAQMRVVNARNEELTSRNVALESQAADAADTLLRQSQALSLSGPANSGASASNSMLSVGAAGSALADEMAQHEHVIDVLRTEVHARNIRISELQVCALSPPSPFSVTVKRALVPPLSQRTLCKFL